MILRVLKNSSFILLTQGLVKVISFFYTIFLARSLGVDDFGLYIVAVSYFSIISSLSDLGVSRYIIRESSYDIKRMPILLSGGILLRLTILSVFFAIFSIVLYFFDPDKMRVSLTLLATLAVMPQSVALTLDCVFAVLQKFSVSGMVTLAFSIVTTLIGVLLVRSGFGSTGAISALILGHLIYILILLIILAKLKKFVFYDISFPQLSKILKESLPYGFLSILGLLYFRIDVLLISYIKGSFDTGIYGAAYKFLEAVIIIPSAFGASIFPMFSNLVNKSPSQTYKLYKKSLLMLFGISLIIAVIYQTLLPQVISLFLPQYKQALPVIRILSVTIPFLFMISVQANILFANRRFLKSLINMSIVNLVLNIALNLILIPKYSYFGAAIVTVISDIIGFLIFLVFIKIQFTSTKIK